MTSRSMTMLAVGDLILDKPNAEFYFALAAPVLKTADVVVGHGETLFTSRGVNTFVEMIPAPPNDPSNMSAFPFAGFNVVTLAGNHVWDSGAPGIEDTITGLRKYGIALTGAGMNIDEARKPAIIERSGTRFGFLNYNCVGPIQSWATADKPGCAFVHIITHYELNVSNPGGPSTIYTFIEPRSLEAMTDDIRKLRHICDVLVVVFHKGIINTPIKLAMYEQPISYAAIDAGADLILGHHAHILRGIEQYKGRTIFHGLGNFIFASMNSVDHRVPHLALQFGVSSVTEFFGPAPDTIERSQTIIAKCTIDGGNISRVSYLPCLINKQGQPEILKNDERGHQVFDYMDKITREAGLNARYEWEGDEVLIMSDKHR